MPKEYLNPTDLFPSLQYGFSQIVTCTGGKMVFLSGQVGWNAHQQLIGPADLRAQSWQAFRNIEIAIRTAGGTLSDIVSIRLYIVQTHIADSPIIQEALKAFFPAERAPTTTWIGVPALANKEFLIEIEAVGIIDENHS